MPYMSIVEPVWSQNFQETPHLCGLGFGLVLTWWNGGKWFLGILQIGYIKFIFHAHPVNAFAKPCPAVASVLTCQSIDSSQNLHSNDLWKKLALPGLNCLLEFRPRVTKRHSNLQADLIYPNIHITWRKSSRKQTTRQPTSSKVASASSIHARSTFHLSGTWNLREVRSW